MVQETHDRIAVTPDVARMQLREALATVLNERVTSHSHAEDGNTATVTATVYYDGVTYRLAASAELASYDWVNMMLAIVEYKVVQQVIGLIETGGAARSARLLEGSNDQ